MRQLGHSLTVFDPVRTKPSDWFAAPRLITLLTLAVLALPVVAADRRNVLMIAVDDLRPELGCYGHPLVKTPNIDRLSREGTLFRRAYCQQALCAPSRASLLTGLRPETTGITGLTQPVRTTLPDVRTLPQHFREAGYTTLSLGKIYHHPNDDNDVGWSTAAWMPANAWDQAVDPANRPLTPGGRSTTWERIDVPDTAYPDGQIAARAVEQLQQLHQSGEPFFLAVGFLKPHLPFFAPKKFWDLYERADLPAPPQPAWPVDMPTIAGTNWEELRNYRGIPKQGPLDEELALTLVHGYYACVSYIDAQVGLLLEELDRTGLRETTVIILWGDHGWKLGDYGAWCKHTNMEIDLHSPLIVAAPRQKSIGRPTSALVELVDVYPTLAELCALEVPTHCEGISFAPLLDDPAQPWKPAAFSLYPRGNVALGYTVRGARWRYTEWIEPGSERVVARELYDHQAGATSAVNLIADPAFAAPAAELAELLDRGRGWQKLNARATHQ